MAAIAPAPVAGATDLRFACHRRCGSPSNLGRSRPISVDPTKCLQTRIRRSIHVSAARPDRQVDSSDEASNFQEDLSYLGKLGAGSFAGAAVIKYGSIIFPEITQPNILQGLIMIFTPVIIAVFLLIKHSREAD